MKIAIITQDSKRLVPYLMDEYDVCGLIECADRKKRTKFFKVLTKLYRMIFRRERPLVSLSKKHNVPYFFLKKNTQKNLKDFLEQVKPDLVIVYSMSFLLKSDVLEILKHGFINLHPSYLPYYRGANPDFWQYYNAESEQGITIHKIDAGEDTGDIILQEKIKVPLGIKSPERLDILINKHGLPLMRRAISMIEEGENNFQKQEPRPELLKARNIIKSEHKGLIPWELWSVERVWNLLRGTESWFEPIKQPSGIYKGQRWSVGGFEKCVTDQSKLGSVQKKENNYYLVCKDGVINLKIHFSLRSLILSFF